MITLSVKRVRVIKTEKFSNVELTFNESFDGYIAKRDERGNIMEGEFVPATINSLDFPPNVLTAILCEHSPEVTKFRSMLEKSFEQFDYDEIFQHVKLNVERTHVNKDETFKSNGVDVVAKRNLYTTEVVGVEVDDDWKQFVNDAHKMKLMKRLGL